jgi:hypothetical protein
MLKLKEHLFESKNLLGATVFLFFCFFVFLFFWGSMFMRLSISLVVWGETC